MSAAPKTFPNPKQVTITYQDGVISVDQDPIEIWSTENDTVEWLTKPADLEFAIRFDKESPFHDRHFHNFRRHSGPLKVGASGHYKYSIIVGGQVLDPGVLVQP